ARGRSLPAAPGRSGARSNSGGSGRADGDALVGKKLLQLTGLEHLADDVATADELALDVKLRNGRPVGVGLDAVTQIGGLQDVETLVADPDVIENLHHLPGETALRKLRCPFHEQHDVVRLHFIFDELFDAHIRFLLGTTPATQPLGPASVRQTRYCYICIPNHCASKVKWRRAGMHRLGWGPDHGRRWTTFT